MTLLNEDGDTLNEKKTVYESYFSRRMDASKKRDSKAFFTHYDPIPSAPSSGVPIEFLKKTRALDEDAERLGLPDTIRWLAHQLFSKSECYFSSSDSNVDFNDPIFEREIRYYYDKYPSEAITKDDLKSLREFGRGPAYMKRGSSTKHTYGVTDLTGIEFAKNLKYLNLNHTLRPSGGGVTDLAPLAGLTGLSELHMSNHDVADLNPIRNLKSLEWLYLSDNPITDLDAISSLEMLRGLIITNISSNNLTPLANLASLENLRADGNNINELSPLIKLINLETLALRQNQITDLSPLSRLHNLEELDLKDNRIVDLAPLSRLTGFRSLDLSHNQLSDVRPLSNLIKLNRLDLTNNQLVDLTPLARLEEIKFLHLRSNQLAYTDLEPLTKLQNITHLDLASNQLTDANLESLTGLQNIGTLDLGSNHLVDLTPLTFAKGLRHIRISHNHVTEKSSISKLQEMGVRVSGYTLQTKIQPTKIQREKEARLNERLKYLEINLDIDSKLNDSEKDRVSLNLFIQWSSRGVSAGREKAAKEAKDKVGLLVEYRTAKKFHD